MAVVTVNSDLILDRHDDTATAADPVQARGRYVSAMGTVANGASDSSGSMYHLADIPSDAILHEDTLVDVTNWGFAQVVVGTKTDTDALIDQTQATENLIDPIVFGTGHGNRLWETLGLSEDPGGVIGIWAHAEATATGAGTMLFRFAYLYH